MRSNRVFWATTFVVFLLLWVIGYYPALTCAWWYRDDFIYGWLFQKNLPFIGAIVVWRGFWEDGRPFAFLGEGFFGLNQYPNAGINIVLRGVQAMAHAGLALFVAATLSHYLSRWQAILITLPFLLWCFNGEVALYSSACHYLWSAFFSLLGMRLIVAGVERDNQQCCRMGMLLTATSLLTLQTAGTVGPMVWVMTLALRFVETGSWKKAYLWEGLWLASGFCLGGLLTTWIATLNHAPRAKIPSDFSDKITYWIELNRHFLFWPNFYPTELCVLHGLLLALGVAIPAFVFLRAGRPVALLVIFALFGAGFILPYLANLVVASDAMPFRSVYFAPLIFTLILAVLFRLTIRSPALTFGLTVLIVMICLSYIPLARNNARDYVQLYLGETQIVRDLEKSATLNHCFKVGVIPVSTSSNPFNLHYPWGESHECDFLYPYSVRPCIELLSPSLQVLSPSPDTVAFLREKTRNLPDAPGIQIFPIPELHLIYLSVK